MIRLINLLYCETYGNAKEVTSFILYSILDCTQNQEEKQARLKCICGPQRKAATQQEWGREIT